MHCCRLRQPHNGLVLLCAAYSLQRMSCLTKHCQWGCLSSFSFFSLVTLTFDLDIQTRPSEGPNTSNLLILCKSVQRFPGDLSHKQKKNKKVADTTKNRTLLACGNYLQSTVGLTKYCWTLVSRYDVCLSKKSVRNRLRIVLFILKCKNRVKQFSDFVHIKALDPDRYWKHLAVGNDE